MIESDLGELFACEREGGIQLQGYLEAGDRFCAMPRLLEKSERKVVMSREIVGAKTGGGVVMRDSFRKPTRHRERDTQVAMHVGIVGLVTERGFVMDNRFIEAAR